MTIETTFPPPPPCPDWCDGKHGNEPDEWESQSKPGDEVERCHARSLGDVAGKIGVEVCAVTEAFRGTVPVTSAPELAVWTREGEAVLNLTEARRFADLLQQAADELERLGGAS